MRSHSKFFCFSPSSFFELNSVIDQFILVLLLLHPFRKNNKCNPNIVCYVSLDLDPHSRAGTPNISHCERNGQTHGDTMHGYYRWNLTKR